MIKNYTSAPILFFVATLIIFSSCNSNNDNEEPDEYVYSFIDQNLKGKINGETWESVSGAAKTIPGDTVEHNFTIRDSVSTDTCSSYSSLKSRVFFSFNDFNDIMIPGVHELNLDWEVVENNKSVTLIYYKGPAIWQTIVSKGAYEILTVDTINNIVTGRMDANWDANNYLNGNFTLKYCEY